MTCICTDGRTLAGDGRVVRETLIVAESCEKVWRNPDGSVAGACGDSEALGLIREWFQTGQPTDRIPRLGDDIAALILRPDGTVWAMDKLFAPYPIDAPASLGSGDAVALGALLAGKTSAEAVEITARCVTTVGGRILDLVPGRAQRRRASRRPRK